MYSYSLQGCFTMSGYFVLTGLQRFEQHMARFYTIWTLSIFSKFRFKTQNPDLYGNLATGLLGRFQEEVERKEDNPKKRPFSTLKRTKVGKS